LRGLNCRRPKKNRDGNPALHILPINRKLAKSAATAN
jgi:hypothetical protein